MKIVKIICLVHLLDAINNGQSLTGLSGLFNIPTANVKEDGSVSIGVNFLNRHQLKYAGGKNDVFTPYITFGFLPFLELSLRITRQIDANYESHVMDRMFSAKIKFFNENNYLPSVTIGLQNPYSTEIDANHFNSTYLVFSKNIVFNNFFDRLQFTVGYGSDIIKAADHQFVGLFGGLSLSLFKMIELMGEYDAERFNTGIRLTLFNHIKLLGGLIDMKHFSGGFAFSFQL